MHACIQGRPDSRYMAGQLGSRAAAGGSCGSRRQLAGTVLVGGRSNGTAARLRAAQWLESSAEQSVGVPVEHAYSMWEDRTRIPQWMPWISSVTVGRHSQDPPALQSLLSS